jgi:hypothetical protein
MMCGGHSGCAATGAGPQQHFAPELAREVTAKVPVRSEDDLLVLRDLIQDRFGAR